MLDPLIDVSGNLQTRQRSVLEAHTKEKPKKIRILKVVSINALDVGLLPNITKTIGIEIAATQAMSPEAKIMM